MNLEPGSVVSGKAGRYRLLEVQGRGGFGVTYRASREADGRAVVVKLLRFERMGEWKALELFEREIKVLRSLHHPSIPAFVDELILGTPEAPEGLGFVQELVPGVDLGRLIGQQERLDQPRMLRWLDEILTVLDHLHSLAPPVIHRDVSPKNIVLRPDGRAFLVDFGSVQAALREGASVASTAAGTFGYAPMEQLVGRATPASDLYALGMTYLAVATGLQPEQMPLEGARVHVRACFRGDERLVALLERITEPDPRRRLGDAAEALQALQWIGAGSALAVRPTASERAAVARVDTADAYLTLLRARLRDEGFEILEGGSLGAIGSNSSASALPLALVARRRGGGLRASSSTIVYVARDRAIGTTSARGDFVARAAQAHAEASGFAHRHVHGDTVVLPLIVAGAPEPDLPAARVARGLAVLPLHVDLGAGAVHLGAGADAAGARLASLLPYFWWLAAPRLLDKPTVRPVRSLLRVALMAGAAALLLFGGAAAYVLSQVPTGTHFLSYAVDPRGGRVVAKAYFRDERSLPGTAVLLGARDRRSETLVLPAGAYLCALATDALVYWTVPVPQGASTFWRQALAGGDPVPLFTLETPRWENCAWHEGRLAYESTGERETALILVREASGASAPARGSIVGDHQAAWLPDGRALVVAHGPEGATHLVRLDLVTGTRTDLTRPSGEAADSRAAVSPDGKRVAFYRSSRRAFGDAVNRQTSAVRDLHVLSLADGQARLLLQDVCIAAPPAWLDPDRIVYGKWTSRRCGLFLYDLAREQTELLSNDYLPE